MFVKATGWLKHSSTCVHPTIIFFAFNWDQKIVLASLAIKLGGDLDLLASREKESDGNTCDTRHLDLVEDTHEFFHESKRQVSIFYAVDS